MNDGIDRAIVDPINHPPGLRRRRQLLRKVNGLLVDGSMCSRTSKRVTTSYFSGSRNGSVSGWVSDDAVVDAEDEEDKCSSRDRFKYRNLPVARCAETVGSILAWSRAIFTNVAEGSRAVILPACVAVPLLALSPVEEEGIVRASDSAKIPPPQPMSR